MRSRQELLHGRPERARTNLRTQSKGRHLKRGRRPGTKNTVVLTLCSEDGWVEEESRHGRQRRRHAQSGPTSPSPTGRGSAPERAISR